MEIKLTDKYTLSPDHPASSYGLGVLVGEDGTVYAPSQPLPLSKIAMGTFGDNIEWLAGDCVKAAALSKIWTDDEVDLMRRYLFQDPKKRFILPADIKLRQTQAEKYLDEIMGDVSQGVHKCYWDEGHAKVAVKIYEATNGRLVMIDGYVETNEG